MLSMMKHWWRKGRAQQMWWRFWQRRWASTSSGAALALHVSIAVWSDAAGICGRKNCLVCAKFFHTPPVSAWEQWPCCKTQSSQQTSTSLADASLRRSLHSRTSFVIKCVIHILVVFLCYLPPVLHISQNYLRHERKLFCTQAERAIERAAEWNHPFERTVSFGQTSFAKQITKFTHLFNNECLPQR